MSNIVTVDCITTCVAVELNEDFDGITTREGDDILSATFDHRWNPSITLQDLIVLDMDMEWMIPAPRAIGDNPALSSAKTAAEQWHIRIPEAIINHPSTLATMELDGSCGDNL